MSIESPNNVFWTEESAEGLSFVPGVNVKVHKPRVNFKPQCGKIDKVKASASNHTYSANAKERSSSQKSVTQQKNSVSKKPRQACLKDLCPEDKERVANLVRELAKAGEEKQATEIILNNERKEFALQIDELKSDKERIEQEQRSLLLEFKECQRLLVFYQQKIAEEQKEVARDINRLLTDTSFNKPQLLSSSRKTTPRRDRIEADEYDDGVTVKEVEETESSPRSAPDSHSTSHFTDVVGTLGESFRPRARAPKTADEKDFARDGKREMRVGFASPRSESETESVLKAQVINCADTPSSDEDAAARDFTDAFERRIRALSPNGRREALLKQKRDLEVEQAHLQSLLSEQEEILRIRQEELKKRHVEYTKRMQHFKRHGSFPSTLSSVGNTLENEDTENTTGYDRDNHYLKTASPDRFPLNEYGTPKRRSFLHKPRSEPVLRSLKLESSAFDDTTDERSASVTDTLSTNRAFSSEREQTSPNGIINDITNFSLLKTSHKSSKNSHLDPSNFSIRSNKAKRSVNERHSTSSLSHTGLSTRSPYRPHTTMNNISTLSDLVSSVEASKSPSSSQHTTPIFTSHGSSVHSDDTVVSLTFDPEDSQLLEEIFFIN